MTVLSIVTLEPSEMVTTSPNSPGTFLSFQVLVSCQFTQHLKALTLYVENLRSYKTYEGYVRYEHVVQKGQLRSTM